MGLFGNIFGGSKTAPQSEEISESKKKLLKEAKELGLNLDPNSSEFDMQRAIDEEKLKKAPKPKEQKSSRRGEY